MEEDHVTKKPEQNSAISKKSLIGIAAGTTGVLLLSSNLIACAGYKAEAGQQPSNPITLQGEPVAHAADNVLVPVRETKSDATPILKQQNLFETRLRKFDKSIIEQGYLLNDLRQSLFEEPLPEEINPDKQTFQQIMNKKGMSLSVKDYGLNPKSGDIYETAKGKSYFLPDVSNEIDVLPREYWPHEGKIKWYYEVSLENADKTKSERWAARYLTSGENSALWVFTRIQAQENGVVEQFVR